MKIKRLIAGGLAAVAGATMIVGSVLGAGTFSDGMGDLVDVSGGTYSSPLIVVGADAATEDIIGATDVAASLVSNYAVDEKTAPGAGATLSVTSGGTDLSTTSTKIYMDDVISSAKSVLTAEDLPVVLASGSFEDDDSNDYNFEQYIYLGTDSNRKVTYGTSGEDVDPTLYIDIEDAAPTASNYFYSTKIVFDTAVNFSSSDVQGNDLELFGSKYTVSSTSTNSEIVLYGSSTKETINAGETTTVTFGGVDYTINVLGVQSQTTAIVTVNGESDEVTEDTEETISGLTFYVDTIIKWDAQTGEGYDGYVQLSLGSQKTILEDGEAVAIGEDEEDVDGTEVNLTTDASGDVSVIEIRVTGGDSDYDAIMSGEAFEDPVWGTFQAEFYGMAPGEDSTSRESIEVSSSGSYANVKLTTKAGDTDEIDFGYYNASTSVVLSHGKKALHVVEGAEIAENEYLVVDAGGFPHLFLVDNVEKATATSAGEVKFKDVFSGATYEAVLAAAGGNQVQKVIDGQTYYLNVSQAEKVRVTWNFNSTDTATYEDPGAYQTIFPALITRNGAMVAFAENVTDGVGLGSATNAVLPGGLVVAAESLGTTQAGVTYDVNLTDNSVNVTGSTDATLIVVEEQDIDDNYNSVFVTTDYDATKETILKEPVLSAAKSDETNSFVTLETDDDMEKLIDTYGTVVTWNEQDDNSAVISYPNDQAIMGIGIGEDPVFSVSGGTGGTYNEAVPITNPIAKFPSEIDTATLDKDLILVGGPCANDLVATLLNTAWNTTDSCDYWLQDATLGSSGNGLIKIVSDAFGSGQKALIVAGTDAADTRNLVANKVIKPTVYTGLSGSEYTGAVA